jgi:hypothetical protein
VERFNQRGLAALLIAPGRRRKPIYTDDQRARIIAEVQRQPDTKVDQTATWSMMLLRQALRKKGCRTSLKKLFVWYSRRQAISSAKHGPGV